jgi:ankyrin repeat protein
MHEFCHSNKLECCGKGKVAAAGGHAAVTELLLGHGAAIDVVNNVGERLLTSASQKGYTDVVAALLRFGVDGASP